MRSVLKKNVNQISIISILLFLFVVLNQGSHNLTAQVNPALSKALQRSLDSLRTLYPVPGISAAIVLPDNSIWTGASGMSDTDSRDSIKADMLMSIGSITKTFTCAIILQLVSENKLSLEDSLYKWIPKIKNIDSTITIRQLLNHTSGIYNFTDNPNFGINIFTNPAKRLSPEDVFSYVGAPMFKPGTGFSYSNTNYYLLGMIIKKITGSELSTELHKRLLTPFNLSNTFLDAEDTIKTKLAVGWSDLNKDGKYENTKGYSRIGWYSATWSAAAMVSNASDAAKWVKYLYGGEVLDKKYLDQMLNFSKLSGGIYGLGTMKNMVLDNEFWGHGGTTPGFETYACYCKQKNISIAVLVNRDNFMPQNLLPGLLKTTLAYVPTYLKEESNNKPGNFNLDQNYPNPFNPTTNIVFRIADCGFVTLKVYDLLGREVITLVNEEKQAGDYSVKFDGSNLTSGIYFYTLNVGNNFLTKKMCLLK